MKDSIINDLLWRYTTKKYDASKKVSEENLQILFEAMRLSPSSINSQPWKFIVIESDDAKARMHNTFVDKHLNNQPHIFDCSHIILFAHNPHYTRGDYAKVVDKYVEDNRIKPDARASAFSAYRFADWNTNEDGCNGSWTKAQTYLALGNALHTLARLKIDSTPLEGIDSDRVNEEFNKELGGYRCDVALAIGYHHPEEDYNVKLPKSRLNLKDIFLRI